jgi:hypothetical protein
MSVPRPGDGSPSVRARDVGRFADLRMPHAAILLFIVHTAQSDCRVGVRKRL